MCIHIYIIMIDGVYINLIDIMVAIINNLLYILYVICFISELFKFIRYKVSNDYVMNFF